MSTKHLKTHLTERCMSEEGGWGMKTEAIKRCIKWAVDAAGLEFADTEAARAELASNEQGLSDAINRAESAEAEAAKLRTMLYDVVSELDLSDGMVERVKELEAVLSKTPAEHCMEERADGNGGCGACSICTKEQRDRAERAEAEVAKLRAEVERMRPVVVEAKRIKYFHVAASRIGWCDCPMCVIVREYDKAQAGKDGEG